MSAMGDAGNRAFGAVLRELGIDGLATAGPEQLAELRRVATDLAEYADIAGSGRGLAAPLPAAPARPAIRPTAGPSADRTGSAD